MDAYSLAQHLRVAAEQYQRDAAAAVKAEQPRIAEAFNWQRQQCEKLADALESGDVRLTMIR